MLHPIGMSVKSKRDQLAEETRLALLKAARQHFVAQGYSATSLNDITRSAGVTKGALYHHFSDGKPALFRAVYSEVELELVARISGSLQSDGDVWRLIEKSISSFVDYAAGPDYRQVVVLDGPAVLGFQAMLDMDKHGALQLLGGMFDALQAGGWLEIDLPRKLLVEIFRGSLGQVAIHLSSVDKASLVEAKTQARDTLLRLLRGLAPRDLAAGDHPYDHDTGPASG